MKIHYAIPFLLGLVFIAGCKEDQSGGTYVAFADVEYVDKFPHNFSLAGGELLDIDIMGALDLEIQDSLLIVSTKNPDGFWSFFSISDNKDLGKYIVKGRGPDELLDSPWVNQQSFSRKADSLYATIYEFSTGTLRKMNVTGTLCSGKLEIEKPDISLPVPLFSFNVLDSNTYLCSTVRDDLRGDVRYIYDNGEQIIPANLERLNNYSVRPGADINILTVHINVNDDGSRVAEAASALNQINLYSIKDSTFAKTICVGKKLVSIESVEEQDPMTKRYYYMTQRSFPDFFGALYLDDVEYDYDMGKSKMPTIQFFDWDGNPLAEVQVDKIITGFDIDFENGHLYTLSHHTEEMYRYDIREILTKMGK